MATTLKPLPPIPQPREPLTDKNTGLITTNWYLWFKRLDEHIRDIEARIAVLEGP